MRSPGTVDDESSMPEWKQRCAAGDGSWRLDRYGDADAPGPHGCCRDGFQPDGRFHRRDCRRRHLAHSGMKSPGETMSARPRAPADGRWDQVVFSQEGQRG